MLPPGLETPYAIIENGRVVLLGPAGEPSVLGGPRLLIVGAGNAVVLECKGEGLRILGPGNHEIGEFEYLKHPIGSKGIVDLRPQVFTGQETKVRTRDNIFLTITVNAFYQIEPARVTGKRLNGRAIESSDVLSIVGAPDYPVYESTIRKAVLNTPAAGWSEGLLPLLLIASLRAVVATYALNEIFDTARSMEKITPDERMIKQIENEVSAQLRLGQYGVWLKSVSIGEIVLPDKVEEYFLEQWTQHIERDLGIRRAEVERDQMVLLGEGRAMALKQVESVKLEARRRMIEMLGPILSTVSKIDNESVATSFISVMNNLTDQVREDESVEMKYIEAMQAVLTRSGPKGVVISPPEPLPGSLPSPPTPLAQIDNPTEKRLMRDGEDEEDV